MKRRNKFKYQAGGPNFFNPSNNFQSLFDPNYSQYSRPSSNVVNSFTSPAYQSFIPPGLVNNPQQNENAQFREQWQFGPNYRHIAGSNFVKSIGAFLRGKNQERDFRAYDRAQNNPLSMLPYSPNTSDQSMYGQSYYNQGGNVDPRLLPEGYHLMPDGTLMSDEMMEYRKGGKKPKDVVKKKQSGGELIPLTGLKARDPQYFDQNWFRGSSILPSDPVQLRNFMDSIHSRKNRIQNDYFYNMEGASDSAVTEAERDIWKNNYLWTTAHNPLPIYKPKDVIKNKKGGGYIGTRYYTEKQLRDFNNMMPGYQTGGPTGQINNDVVFNQLLNKSQDNETFIPIDQRNIASKIKDNQRYSNMVGSLSIPSKLDEDVNTADLINSVIGSGRFTNQSQQGRSLLGKVSPEFINYINLFSQREGIRNLTPEQRVSEFYKGRSGNQGIQGEMERFKLGYGPEHLYRTAKDPVLPLTKQRKPTINFQYGGAFPEQEIEQSIENEILNRNYNQQDTFDNQQELTEQRGRYQEDEFFDDINRNPQRFSKRRNNNDYIPELGFGYVEDMLSSLGLNVNDYMSLFNEQQRYQKGGRTPVYTSDPNDPRIRNYKDSLILYNATKNDINNIKKMSKNEWWDYVGRWSKLNPDADKAYIRLGNSIGNFPEPIRKFSYEGIENGREHDEAREYKKPVQPVEYRKRRPVEYSDVSSLNYNYNNPNVLGNNYKSMDISQKPTNFSITYPEYENGPGAQRSAYFNSYDKYKSTLNALRDQFLSSQEAGDKSSASALLGNLPSYNKGGYYYVSDDELKNLNKGGYNFEIIK